MLPSVLPRLATDSAARVFPGVWKPLLLRSPSGDGAPSLPPLSPFLSFIFFPTCFWRQWSAFLGAWCPLPAFRSYFVEFTQGWNVLLMNLWGRKWSSRPIPPPSFPLSPRLIFLKIILGLYSKWILELACQFSFQSQRKAMLKNAQTTAQLYSSHKLVK